MIDQIAPHIPVLLDEMLQVMDPEDHKIYVDGTFGAGGYSSALLARANCTVYGIDRDPEVVSYAESVAKQYSGRLKFVPGCFGDMEQLLQERGIEQVDGIVLDIGVSSMQLDQKERGFSFNGDAYLDMRMSRDGVDAYHLINNATEQELADIIYRFGDEVKSRFIARKIVERRAIAPIETTLELASIVRSVVRKKDKKIDAATKTFQAIRIWVNDELGQLERALSAAERVLKVGGKLVVISFHSLEDKIVKDFLYTKSGKKSSVSRYMPEVASDVVSFKLLTRGAMQPSDQEINANPRSRSARLRGAIKLGDSHD